MNNIKIEDNFADMIETTLKQFVCFINKNYNVFFENETIYDYISNNDNYIKNFIPYFYLFLKEYDIPYKIFEKIDKNKFIELALARNIEK